MSECFSFGMVWCLGMGIVLYHFLATKKSSYLQGQVSESVTRNQIAFDIIGGIVLPILCLIFDPIVFQNLGQLIEFQIFFYAAILIEMVTLML